MRKENKDYSTVEPRYNEEPRTWQNMFTITRFIITDTRRYRSLYRKLRYVEVRKIGSSRVVNTQFDQDAMYSPKRLNQQLCHSLLTNKK